MTLRKLGMVKYVGICEISQELIVKYEVTHTLKQGMKKHCIWKKTLEGDTCEGRNMYRTWMILKSHCFILGWLT
jgi:hypothetical protein